MLHLHFTIRPKISIDKEQYAIGENVIFHLFSDTATSYTIGIHKNGEPYDIIWDTTNTDYSYSFNEAGSYYAYVSASNSSGYLDSSGIWFTVYGSKPHESILKISKTKYTIGEDVVFDMSSDSATKFSIGIHKNGTPYDIIWDVEDNKYSYKLLEAGSYYAYVSSSNSLGYLDSNGVWFEVYDTAPTKSTISIPKEKFAVGESVDFTMSSDTATSYTIGIHKNGIPYDIIWNTTNETYSYELTEAGNYYAYAASTNDLGVLDSNGVWFTVYDHAPEISKITVEKNEYMIGDEITFSVESDTATAYSIGLYKDGIRVIRHEEHKNVEKAEKGGN